MRLCAFRFHNKAHFFLRQASSTWCVFLCSTALVPLVQLALLVLLVLLVLLLLLATGPAGATGAAGAACAKNWCRIGNTAGR